MSEENETRTDEAGRTGATCSAVDRALALVSAGTLKTQLWYKRASKMCIHCHGMESVDQVASRVLAGEVRKVRDQLRDERTASDMLAQALIGKYSQEEALDRYEKTLEDSRAFKLDRQNAKPSRSAGE